MASLPGHLFVLNSYLPVSYYKVQAFIYQGLLVVFECNYLYAPCRLHHPHTPSLIQILTTSIVVAEDSPSCMGVVNFLSILYPSYGASLAWMSPPQRRYLK